MNGQYTAGLLVFSGGKSTRSQWSWALGSSSAQMYFIVNTMLGKHFSVSRIIMNTPVLH